MPPPPPKEATANCVRKIQYTTLSSVRRIRVMKLNATFNNILVMSCRSVLLVEETEVPGENHRPIASH